MSYQDTRSWFPYLSIETQLVYFTAPADLADYFCYKEKLIDNCVIRIRISYLKPFNCANKLAVFIIIIIMSPHHHIYL